jgi:DNA-directed RNA polymerase specialized sigma24 family protein
MLLRRLREELTVESFLVFELLYVRLLSAPEAASMLGCEVQAVYTRKSRIRTQVRSLLGELERCSWDG